MPSGKKKSKKVKNTKLRGVNMLMIMDDAHKLSHAGHKREAADKFMEAVLSAPSKWTKHRYSAFGEYRYHNKYSCTSSQIEVKTVHKAAGHIPAGKFVSNS